MKKWMILIALVLCVGVIILRVAGTGSADRHQKGKSLRAEESSIHHEDAVPVKIMVLTTRNFSVNVNVVGTSRAKQDYVLSAKLNGEINYLNADIGMKVARGQLIARIDPEMVEANFKQAEANYSLASSAYSRQKNLAAQGLVSAQQLETAETQYKSAGAALTLAKVNLNYSRIISPIHGVIAEKNVSVHDMAVMGRPIVRVVNLDRLEIEVGVNDQQVARLQKGNKAHIRWTAYPDRAFEGTVTHVGMQSNQDTRTFPVIIELDNKEGLIKGGMIADVTIRLNSLENAIVIPFSLVLKSQDGNYVYIEKNGRAIKQSVVLDDLQGELVRISQGLSAGDHLIIEGNNYVADQSAVQVIQ